jgi:hypothetical protein
MNSYYTIQGIVNRELAEPEDYGEGFSKNTYVIYPIWVIDLGPTTQNSELTLF